MACPHALKAQQALTDGKIVMDIIDPFTPSVDMKIWYHNEELAGGMELAAIQTQLGRPRVVIRGKGLQAAELYTLVMTHADEECDAKDREKLHWEATGYLPAQPETPGVHRYAFLLFKQPAPEKAGCRFRPNEWRRQDFSTRKFAKKYNLGLPVAGMHFVVRAPAPEEGQSAFLKRTHDNHVLAADKPVPKGEVMTGHL
eukprot:jgi/Mesen1/2911/ME000175S02064